MLKLMFSKKATRFDKIFTVDLTYAVSVKYTVKISSIFVAFLEILTLHNGAKYF